MNWTLALEHNRTILLRNVTWLFTWLKLEVGGTVETLPRINHGTILFVLRPSESACRRLIFAAMFVLGTKAARLLERVERTARGKSREAQERAAPQAVPSFRLIDPRRSFDLFPDRAKYASGPGPRVTVFGSDDPVFDRRDLYAYQERLERLKNSRSGEDVGAAGLCGRMNALITALEDLPAQAQRMANLQARMERLRERKGAPSLHPLRTGLPPGFRQRQKHEVDEVLAECHWLAKMAPQDFGPPKPG